MLPELSPPLENSQTVKMMAVLEQWEASGLHTNNNEKYFWLLLFKLGLDAAVFYACCPKQYTFFLNVSSLSIVVADFLLTFFMGAVWFLGIEGSFASACLLLGKASATYEVLPLPMVGLGLIDYCFHDNLLINNTALSKLLKNVILTMLVWMTALTYSFGFFHSEPIQLSYVTEVKVLVCKVEESTAITVIVLGLFTVTFFMMLPFCSRIPQWVKEADKIYEARELQEKTTSDLFFTSNWTHGSETNGKEEEQLPEKKFWMRPPLWSSLLLGFLIFWMPYLVVTISCLLCGFAVPAYISVNLLWLECTNSFLVGLIFWVKSNIRGPYIYLPENVCSWQIYWQLSKGTAQPEAAIAVLNPTQVNKKDLLDV